jgi:cysteine desulfurase
MESSFVYLDYAASSPLRACALEVQARYESLPCAGANPNSLHTLGRMAQSELEKARRTLATCIGGGFRSPDIAFCGGGTEANNICLLGMAQGARAKDRKRTRVLMDAVEHDSVLDVAQTLKGLGFKVDIVPVGSDGKVDTDTFSSMLGSDVAIVSVMYANNETGVIQPVSELAKLAKQAGALVHTDAIQAFARISIDVKDVDAVTIAGHKFGAPVSAAALAMRGRLLLQLFWAVDRRTTVVLARKTCVTPSRLPLPPSSAAMSFQKCAPRYRPWPTMCMRGCAQKARESFPPRKPSSTTDTFPAS